jgi:hypothetical protein
MLRILIVGILMLALYLGLISAIISAAPYIAVGIMILGASLLLSKGRRKPPDQKP